MRKYLDIFRDGELIQTVTYQKGPFGWQAINFNPDRYMPFMMHLPVSSHKEALLRDGLTWKWRGEPDDLIA